MAESDSMPGCAAAPPASCTAHGKPPGYCPASASAAAAWAAHCASRRHVDDPCSRRARSDSVMECIPRTSAHPLLCMRPMVLTVSLLAQTAV